jgi:hypothetical protein
MHYTKLTLLSLAASIEIGAALPVTISVPKIAGLAAGG